MALGLLNAEQMLKDIESGMTDSDLLEKHGFSRTSIEALVDGALALGIGARSRAAIGHSPDAQPGKPPLNIRMTQHSYWVSDLLDDSLPFPSFRSSMVGP